MWGKRMFPSFEAVLQPLSYHIPQEIHSLYCLNTSYNMPSPAIEPRTVACQADVLATTRPGLSNYKMSSAKKACSYSSVVYYGTPVFAYYIGNIYVFLRATSEKRCSPHCLSTGEDTRAHAASDDGAVTPTSLRQCHQQPIGICTRYHRESAPNACRLKSDGNRAF